jgi:hypothetical protein
MGWLVLRHGDGRKGEREARGETNERERDREREKGRRERLDGAREMDCVDWRRWNDCAATGPFLFDAVCLPAQSAAMLLIK